MCLFFHKLYTYS